MNDYINIGKVAATFGLKGEVIITHALGKKTTLKNIETIFIEQTKGSYIPYFIQSSKAKSENEIYVKLDGIDTKESAHRFIKKQAWLLNEDFRKLVSKSSPVALLGFELINEQKSLGSIEEVIEQPHQVLLRITINNKEALIPLHENTLEKIDHKKSRCMLHCRMGCWKFIVDICKVADFAYSIQQVPDLPLHKEIFIKISRCVCSIMKLKVQECDARKA